MRLQRLVARLLAAGVLCAAVPAQADPLTVFATVEAIAGATVAGFVATAVSFVTTYGAYILAGYSIYGSIAARNKAKRAAAAARAAYNAGLQDRNITALSAAPGRRVVYGRADTGGDLVAIFTSDKTSHALSGFRIGTVTKPDAYKHLIIVWAAHQCQSINDLKIDGIPVGALDANGWATGAEWVKSAPSPTAYGQLAGNLRSQTLPAGSTIVSVTLITGADGSTHTPIANGAGGWSFAGTTLTLPGSVTVSGFAYTPTAADTWDISYSSDDVDGTSTVRVRHHLGAPDQAADAELMALLPEQWSSDHRLRGRCYSWVTLDLERQQFQGGPPGITADISGALVLDPRTGTTAWSDNPALCAYDYLRRVEGMNVSDVEVDVASVIAAANTCDVSTSFTVGGSTVTGPRYSCNGVFVAGQAKEAVLIDICEAMAGFATYSGQWRLLAGDWTPPVMDLTDADLAGSINIVQAGEPSGQLFNSVRGQYVPANSSVPADIEAYSNATFVAADGQPLYEDIELPFTNSRARAKNISRIKVEQSRAGLVILFPAQLRAWPLQTGDRVTVTSTEYGFLAKTFRVTDWQFGLRSPVALTLQEDDASIYDLADAALADPNPNTNLPSPWTVAPLASATAASGTAQLQRLGDGTIISRVLVTWPRSTAAYMQGGVIELAWREAGSTVVHTVNADGNDTQAYLTGVRDGTIITIQLTAINTQGARSSPVTVVHQVIGKSQPPADVAGLAASVIPGAVHITWTRCADADYDYTVLRYGASWAAGTALPYNRPGNSYDWPWPAPGSYTIWAVNVDTSGNQSTPVSTAVTVGSSIYIGAGQFTGSIGGGNLLPNSSFERDAGADGYADGWGNYTGFGSPSLSTDTPSGTGYSQRVVTLGGVATPRLALVSGRPFVPAGQVVTISCYVKAPAGSQLFLGAKGAAAATGGAEVYQGFPTSAPVATGAWQRLAIKGAPPVDCYVLPTIGLTSTPAAGVAVLVDQAQLEFGDVITAYAPSVYEAQSAADSAASAAAAAQADADAANALLADISADNKLTALEKQSLRKEWDGEVSAKAGIEAQATAYGITTEKTAFINALVALGTYLNNGTAWAFSTSVPPSWISDAQLATTTTITGATLRSTWKAYTDARQALLNAIYAKAKALADTAQADADAAQAAAASAQADADAANAQLADIGADNKLTPGEKQSLRKLWDQLINEKAGINAQASAYSITTENTTYNAQVQALGNYLNNGTAYTLSTATPPSWISDANLGTTTTVVGATLRTNWLNATTARQVLLNKIAAVAGTLASWSGVSGSGKPADNATRNQVFFQDGDPVSSPGGVVDGAIWVSSTKSWQRVSGSWKPYVGSGSVDTGQLTSTAATDVTEFTFASIAFSNIA